MPTTALATCKCDARMGKPGTKQRHLLVSVDALGHEPAPPMSALHAAIRDAVERHHGQFGARAAQGALQTRHYSPSARLCMVHTPLAQSRTVRDAIGRVEFVRQQPVRLAVVRAFGNMRCAHRELGRRLEAALAGADARAQKELRGALAGLAS